MNKIWLILQREFLNRVQKKSFLIATIVLPLIFPALMAVLVYAAIEQKKNATKDIVHYVDESSKFVPDTAKFIFKKFEGSLDDAKKKHFKTIKATACYTFRILKLPTPAASRSIQK